MEQQLFMNFGVSSVAKLNSRASLSSDAYFISNSSFGIADGVEEWQKFGLDSQLFASELMQACKLHMGSLSMQKSLSEAHRNMLNFGSSTALLGSFSENLLSVLTLGDSSLVVVRKVDKKDTVVFKTTDQNHAFNCPYQLAHLPSPRDYSDLERQGLTKLIDFLKRQKKDMDDSAQDALFYTFPLQPQDVVIAATDGLFDNLFQHEICALVANKTEKPTLLAKKLLRAAQRRAIDRQCITPFAKAAGEAGFRYLGGRNDDILVLVAYVY